jgi:hypothetical protein
VTLAAVDVDTLSRTNTFAHVLLSPFVPSTDSLLENSEVFRVSHGLNLGNDGWKGIFARAERIVKGDW